MARRPTMHYILGLPGAGKTTVMTGRSRYEDGKTVRSSTGVLGALRLTNHVWRAVDMQFATHVDGEGQHTFVLRGGHHDLKVAPPCILVDHAVEMGRQSLPFLLSGDGRVAVLGAYHSSAAVRAPELQGPDKYGPPQRTRIKTLVAELVARGQVEHIVCDGLALLQSSGRPFVDRVMATCRVVSHVVDTPRAVCQARFRRRNEHMVAEGRLKYYPTAFNAEATWDKLDAVIAKFTARAHAVEHYVDAAAATAAIAALLHARGAAHENEESKVAAFKEGASKEGASKDGASNGEVAGHNPVAPTRRGKRARGGVAVTTPRTKRARRRRRTAART